MVKHLLACFTVLFSLHAAADDIPEPLAWWQQLSDAAWQDQPTLIRHLTIRSGTPAKAKRWDKTMQEFSELGFLQYVPNESADFIKRLNPDQDISDLPQNILLDPALFQLVLTDRGSKVSVQASSKGNYKTLTSWSITAADRKTSPSVLNWLSRNLGYDAVVIDARDGMILAGLLKNTSELGQGLLVKDSSKRWVIKESNTRGEALLQMLKTSGSLAVFEVLLAKGETLAVSKGSKILLGQNNNWMKLMQPAPTIRKPKALTNPANPTPSKAAAPAPNEQTAPEESSAPKGPSLPPSP
jgi:hypothetical protein